MALDPQLAGTVLRVAGLIAARDRRARGLAAPAGLAPPPLPAPRPLQDTPPGPLPLDPLNNPDDAARLSRIRSEIASQSATQASQTPLPAPTIPTPQQTVLGAASNIPGLGGVIRSLPRAAQEVADSPLGGPLGQAAEALDAPRGMVVSDIGDDMYRRATGQQSTPEVFIREQIPVISVAMDWAVANPEKVIAAQEQGFDSRDGSIHYEGGRAVWEAYSREELTGNLPGALTTIATDPLNLLGGPAKSAGLGVARRGAQIAAAHPLAGRALIGAGKGMALPDVAVEQGLDLAKQGAGALVRGAQTAPGIDRVAAQVGRLFSASPQAQAARRLNAWQAAQMQETAALGRAGTPLTQAAETIAAQNITETITTAPAYEEAFSAVRSSRTQAAARAESRLNALAKTAPDDATRQTIDSIWRELDEARESILSSTESITRGGPGRDIRNAANRAELWLAEHNAEVDARALLERTGATPPPYRNMQPRGSVAADLDTLAWNPSDEVADAALSRVEALEEEAERLLGFESTVTTNLSMAREAAEDNRGRISGREMGSAAPTTPSPTTLTTATDPHLSDLPEPDRAAWQASLADAGGRQAAFAAADARLRQTWEAVERLPPGEALFSEAGQLARTTYGEATQEANRLLEATKRADDAGSLAASTLPPDVGAAILGTGGARAARDAADEAFSVGPIVAPEVSGFLASPFEEASQYAGRAIGEVASELRAQLATDTARLGELMAQPRGLLDDKGRKELEQLLERFPEARRGGVQAIDAGAHLRRVMGEAFEEESGYRAATGLGAGVDRASRIYSAATLLMPWSFPRYYLANMAGDTWQVLLAHGPAATAAASDPRTLRDLTRYAVKGGDPLVGAVGDAAKGWGLGGFHPTLVRENLAEALWRRERAAVNRAGGRARLNALGKVDEVTGAITDIPRNVANGLEWSHRTGLWAFLMDQEAIGRKAGFARDMADVVARHNIDEGDLRAILEYTTRIDGSEVAEKIGRLALSKGTEAKEARGLAEEVGRRWASEVYNADEAARAGVNKALFSYEQKNVDVALRRVIPFHYWMSRAIPFYAEQALRHPGYAASYYRMYQATEGAAQAEGWPAPLQTFMKIAVGPGGMMLMANPLAAIGLMDFAFESNGGYTEENVSAVGNLLQRAGDYGFTLLPWWGAALNLTGYLGDSPVNLDPIGTHQARRFIGTMVQLAAGEGALGQEPRLLDKPYDQMWQNVRDALSGFLPGSSQIPPSDPGAMPQIQLRNIMLKKELESRGMTVDDYLALVAAGQTDATSPEALQVAEIHDAVAAAELDGGAAWQGAVREWARGNAVTTLLGAIVPGPKKVRQEEGLAIQAVAGSVYSETPVIAGVGPIPDHDPGLLVDENDRAFVERWAERFGSDYRVGDLQRMQEAAREANTLQNAPPETAAILSQQAAYYALGTEEERRTLDQYYDILFAGGDVSLGGVSTTRLARGRGGRLWMSQAELSALSQDERSEIADQWLKEQQGGRREMRRIKELRDLYEQTHPEWAAYQRWQRDTRDQWGGSGNFRAAAARANPNYARWLNDETSRLRRQGMSLSQINLELDSNALSLNAYLAYNGQRRSRYDPAPLPTGTPLPVASEGAPEGALGGAGGYGESQSWDQRVYAALEDTEDAMRASERHLGVRLDALPPPFQQGYLASADYPDAARPPSDFWIYEDYLNFANQQNRAGGDTSVDAFIASTSREPGRLRERFEPNVWPPQSA